MFAMFATAWVGSLATGERRTELELAGYVHEDWGTAACM